MLLTGEENTTMMVLIDGFRPGEQNLLCSTNDRMRRISLVALAVFFLVFSSFAVFHAYANDELLDAHGCQIGQWVQHNQSAVFSVVLISAALAAIFVSNPLFRNPYTRPFLSTASLRAPPRSRP